MGWPPDSTRLDPSRAVGGSADRRDWGMVCRGHVEGDHRPGLEVSGSAVCVPLGESPTGGKRIAARISAARTA